MDFANELVSNASPRIRKAATKIYKDKIFGYESQLVGSLKYLIDKPKFWQTQSIIIRALGVTGCIDSVQYLKELLSREFYATVLYRDLGFSICMLTDIRENRMDFSISTLASDNGLLISGVCSAILFAEFQPSNKDMAKLMGSIIDIDTDEGAVITPRCYIAAISYQWPRDLTNTFLDICAKSECEMLVEIAESSMRGKKTRYILV